jgi:hypothetical protein
VEVTLATIAPQGEFHSEMTTDGVDTAEALRWQKTNQEG